MSVKTGTFTGKITKISVNTGEKPMLSVKILTQQGMLTWTMRAWIDVQKRYGNLEASRGIPGLEKLAAELSEDTEKVMSPCAALWIKRAEFENKVEITVSVTNQLDDKGEIVRNPNNKNPYFNVNIEPFDPDIDEEEAQDIFGLEEISDEEAQDNFAPSKTGTDD